METYHLWIAFGMLIISILTSILSFVKSNEANKIASESLEIAENSQTNTLREMIHAEQIKVVKGLMSTLTQIEFKLDDYIDEEDSQSKENVGDNLINLRESFWQVFFEASIFTEYDTDKTINTNFNQVSKVITRAVLGKSITHKEYENCFFEIENALRDMIGVNELSTENRILIRRNYWDEESFEDDETTTPN